MKPKRAPGRRGMLPAARMSFLTSNLGLVIGLVVLALGLVSARFTKDPVLRTDLLGSARWLGTFLVLRLNAFWLQKLIIQEWHPYLRVIWMLALAFGVVRFVVAMALGLRRRLSSAPSAKIHRDVADFVLYVLVAIPILKTQLKLDVTTMLGTSAVLSLVLGFALQDTLGNLFSGLSLQLEAPYRVGDFVRVGEQEGRVTQVNWRSTRILTMRREEVTVPNSQVAKQVVTNLSRGGQPVAIDLTFGASYSAAPNYVRAETLETLREAPLVLNDPPPWVRVSAFGDSAVTYKIRFFLSDYANLPHATDEVLSRLWYRFGRDGIEIPFPQRVVHVRQAEALTRQPMADLLSKIPFFAPFPADELASLSRAAVERRFGAGEEVLTEGREGATFFVVISGRLSVRVGQPPAEVSQLERGQAVGEMSLLTGEPRSATVVAVEDSVLYEFSRDVFARHFQQNPERLAQLAQLIEARKAERDAALATARSAAGPTSGRTLERLREIFGLRS